MTPADDFELGRCADCVFSAVSVVKGHEALTCHRYAPRPDQGGVGYGESPWAWPVVGTDEFCGEYKAREVGR